MWLCCEVSYEFVMTRSYVEARCEIMFLYLLLLYLCVYNLLTFNLNSDCVFYNLMLVYCCSCSVIIIVSF